MPSAALQRARGATRTTPLTPPPTPMHANQRKSTSHCALSVRSDIEIRIGSSSVLRKDTGKRRRLAQRLPWICVRTGRLRETVRAPARSLAVKLIDCGMRLDRPRVT